MDIVYHYQAIGTELSKLAPAPFTKIMLESRVTDDTADMGVEYVTNNGSVNFIELSSDSASAIANNLIALRRAMKQDGQEYWKRSVFTFTPNGKFNLDVFYDD